MAYRVRVAELAALLGVTPAEILATCRRLKIPVAAAASILDRSECDMIKRELSSRPATVAKTAAPPRQRVQNAAWTRLEKAHLDGTSVQGRVTSVVKGGVTVDVGVRGFIPASQLDVSYVEDLSRFIGTTIDARVLELDPTRNSAVLSRRLHLEAARDAANAELLSSIQPGQERPATVSRVRPNGMEVDLGGVTSWVPIGAIPVPAGQPIAACYTPGQQVSVTVCDVRGEEVVISLYLADTAAVAASDRPLAGWPDRIASRCSVAEGAVVVALCEEDCSEAEVLIREVVGATRESGIRELRVIVPSTRRREVRAALTKLGPAHSVTSRRQVDDGFVLGILPGKAAQ